jgi:hypothetical protein
VLIPNKQGDYSLRGSDLKESDNTLHPSQYQQALESNLAPYVLDRLWLVLACLCQGKLALIMEHIRDWNGSNRQQMKS